MKVIKFSSDYGYCNSFLVINGGQDGFLIDCATPDLTDKIDKLGIRVKTVLLTHGHFDHVTGCRAFVEDCASFYCGEKEKPLIFSKEYLGIFGGVKVPSFEINRGLADGDEFKLCGLNVKVISTPGHTAGSVCYLIGGCLFTGDTLFRGSIGRTDLPSGNTAEIMKSLKKLASLKGDYKVYCGHGEDTTLDFERFHNPYLR